MDIAELTKIIFKRIQTIDPDMAIRNLGYIYVKDPMEEEVMQLAYGPEQALLLKIAEGKMTLRFPSTNAMGMGAGAGVGGVASSSSSQVHEFPFGPRSYSSPCALHPMNWDPHAAPEQYDHAINCGAYYYGASSTSSRHSRKFPSMPEFPIKPCHYFYRGYCKHGSNCKFYHGPLYEEVYRAAAANGFYVGDGIGGEDGCCRYANGSLEKLESEIAELLRSRGGGPLSIASLPMLYFDKYGKGIQAEGYLTESQRHGKAGYSLTKLLARMKNSIHLIDRPHGQHCVILAEDGVKYMECRNDRIDSSSHQIYLTFPSESTFNDEDVSEYFTKFGPVRDVRIPSQEKRMYAFVSFVFHETVSKILMMKNPHYIGGARVLVKPYREKSRMDRSYMKASMYYPTHYMDEPESSSAAMQREPDHYSYFNNLWMDEQESMLEMERNRFSELNISQNQLSPQGIEEFNFSEGPSDLPVQDHFSYTLEALNRSMSLNEENANHAAYSDQDSHLIQLPDSPFAHSVVESTISGAI